MKMHKFVSSSCFFEGIDIASANYETQQIQQLYKNYKNYRVLFAKAK